MINIAICDDEPLELERTRLMLKQYTEERLHLSIQSYSFSSPLELLTYVDQHQKMDVLLLDIYMPGLLGIEVAQELRAMGDDGQIVFLTTSRDHAIEAFALNATHYLIKPYTAEALFAALDKAVDQLVKEENAFITLKSTEGICRIDLEKMVFAESDGHTQRIVLSDGKQVVVRMTSSELFELLIARQNFYKCGTTYIINMDYIAEFSSKEVVFSTGRLLPMISRKFAEFKKTYMDYCCSC